ncbi:MAG: nitrogen regulation protein NR(II) [Gammaproteobacteria bacterium]|nr:nitrogen regulation protein NR(II) [Gammaproteobacteria bacterium]
MSSAPDILDHLTQAVLVVDRKLNVTYLNQTAEAVIGQSGSRCIGRPIAGLITDPGEHVNVLLDTLKSGQPFTKREAKLHGPMLGEIRADYSVQQLGSDELLIEIQPLDRIMRIGRDEETASAQDTTRKLLRGLAHEIKNPLGGIRGAAQLLDRELATRDQRDYTRIIIEEADRLRNLVDRMLSPHERPRLQIVNIHEVLERVIQLTDAESRGRIQFVRDYDPSLPEFVGDFEKLVQAALNILRNATEAMANTEAPRIEINSRVIRQHTIGAVRHRLVAKVDIIDNGPGVPEDIADQMFYPMISGQPNGTGLGLAITQNIIHQHNGFLECDSVPGRTAFSIYLPLESEEKEENKKNMEHAEQTAVTHHGE